MSHIKAYRSGIKPDPYIDFVEWANTHFRLTKESSVEPGRYRTSRTPWVEEILLEGKKIVIVEDAIKKVHKLKTPQRGEQSK